MHRTNLPDTQHYIPSLDGLRAGAVILVILSHFGLDNVVPGGFGVTAFFWISGYLITGQMLSEIGRTGRLDFPKFYLRRFFRLMPAAVFYILIAGSLFVAIGGVMPVAAWLSAIFYAANYYDLYVMFQPLASGVQSPLTHLWSLAVEEHFYILWPLALVTLYRRHWAVGVLLSVCLAVLAWRLWLYGQCFSGDLPGPPGGVCGLRVEYRLYKATDTRIDSSPCLPPGLPGSGWNGRSDRAWSWPPQRWPCSGLLSGGATSFVKSGATPCKASHCRC